MTCKGPSQASLHHSSSYFHQSSYSLAPRFTKVHPGHCIPLFRRMNSYPNTPRILGADNQAFTYPTDGLVQDDNKETVVSFVIKDAEKGHQDVTSGPGSEER